MSRTQQTVDWAARRQAHRLARAADRDAVVRHEHEYVARLSPGQTAVVFLIGVAIGLAPWILKWLFFDVPA